MKINVPESSTKELPLVSILIPCWGCKNYIAEAIESAIAQDYEPLEIIVVEDWGNDGTYEEAMKFSDPRLRVYRNEKNLGQYGNKNRALELAKGILIKYLDGDDVLETWAVSRLVSGWLEGGPGTGVVFGQFIIIDALGNSVAIPHPWGVSGRCDGKRVLELVTGIRQSGSRFGNVTPHLFQKTVLEGIGGFPNNNAGPGDIETFLKLLCVTDVYFVGDQVARYRRNPGGMATRTFGVRESTDYIAMVEHLGKYFKSVQDLPTHLYDEQFLRQWKVRASGHNIMPSFQHKLRRLPNQYDAIKAVYAEKGMEKEFAVFVRKALLQYIGRTLTTKIRQRLGLPQHPPLFTKKQALYISTINK